MIPVRPFALVALAMAGAAAAVPSPLPTPAAMPVIDPIVITAPRGATADAERLAIATEIAAMMMPVGSFRPAVQTMIDRSADSARNAMLNAPMRVFVRDAAIKPSTPIHIDEPTATKAMAVIDPAYPQRQRIVTDMLTTSIAATVDGHEPRARAAMAQAYAGRMSAADLAALRDFLRTPSGAAFTQAQAGIGRDPAIAAAARELQSRLDAERPTVMKAIAGATAKLPKLRRYVDLTETEKAEVFRLIGATPASTTP